MSTTMCSVLVLLLACTIHSSCISHVDYAVSYTVFGSEAVTGNSELLTLLETKLVTTGREKDMHTRPIIISLVLAALKFYATKLKRD